MEVKQTKQSLRNIQIVGAVSEINMCIEEKEIEIKGKKTKCNAVVKKEFKNPSMTVEVNGSIIGVDFINTYEINKEGEHNSKFDGMCTMLDTYETKLTASVKTEKNKIEASKNNLEEYETIDPTRVKVDAMISLNEYAKNEEFKSYLQILCFNPCTSRSVPEEDYADGSMNGIIRNKKPELNKDGEETGRLLVEFCCFDKQGAIFPYSLVVEEDIADEFNSTYENGQCCKLDVEIKMKRVGAKKIQKSGFGRRESKSVDGYEIPEIAVFYGYEPYEEDNDYFIDLDTVKMAMKEREIFIEAKVNESKNGGTQKKESKGMGTKKPIDNDEIPF